MMNIKDWNIEEMTGYKPMTTFYRDFSIADKFGISAVIDTYNRAMTSCEYSYKYLTELVMTLNWKIWEHYETNKELAKTYNDLWELAQGIAENTLKDDELSYYYRTTD